MNFINHHKYTNEMQLAVSNLVFKINPSITVELGYGAGYITNVILQAMSNDSELVGYDLISPKLTISNLSKNITTKKIKLIQDDVFNSFLKNPFKFDLLIVDIDNTWELIEQVVIQNKFVYDCIKNGATVLIEGGADNHPRMNRNTLLNYHTKIGRSIFDFEIIGGNRTSLSKLIINYENVK